MAKMLILRGKAGNYPWKGVKNWPKGALDEPSAIEYAELRGYEGVPLDVAGYTSDNSEQVKQAKLAIDGDDSITALYGFSAGGYNMMRIIGRMTKDQKARLRLVVVLGAPGMTLSTISGRWELIYRVDPPKEKGGHMGGPDALLESAKKAGQSPP